MKNTPEYNKAYYEANKVKMMNQISEARKKRRLNTMLDKLNNGLYKKKPISATVRHGVKFNEETGKYYVD